MPNIGGTGFILIILVALLLFGPSKLPELGRAFGRTLREFKNGAKEIMEDATAEIKEAPRSDAQKLEASKPEYRSKEPAAATEGEPQLATDKRLPE